MQRDYYLNQKKTLEINPKHPIVKELLRRVEDNPTDKSASDMPYNTAILSSGYSLKTTVNVAQQIDADEMPDEDEEPQEEHDDQDQDKLFKNETEVPAMMTALHYARDRQTHTTSPALRTGTCTKTKSRRGTRRSR
jgi:hypothetical protein